MNVQTTIKPETDLVAKALENPVALFADAAKFSDFYARVKAETEKMTPDTSTNKGRDEIRSMARKVVTTKTTLDKAAKALTEEWRNQTNQVNAARNKMVADLAALAEEVRKPLTEWEAAEELRVECGNRLIASFREAAVVTTDDTSATIRARGKRVFDTEVGADLGDMLDQVQAAKDGVVTTLRNALAYALKEEADRAELEKLRAEKEARDEADRIARAAEEAAERKREYARAIIEHINQCGLGMIGGKTYPYGVLLHELESKIGAGEDQFGDMAGEVEAARVKTLASLNEAMERQAEHREREAAEAAAREARDEEKRKAEAAQNNRAAEHAAELAAAAKRADDAERAAQEERDCIAAKEAQRIADEKAEAAEQAKRDRNRAHRAQVMGEAKIAIMAAGKDVSDEAAVLIVKAIVAGSIPHTSLRF